MELNRCKYVWVLLITLSLPAILSYYRSNYGQMITRDTGDITAALGRKLMVSRRQKGPNTSPNNSSVSLPRPVINGIKSVIVFIGHAHSGHSIVGSILDSHPHIVVSHELNLFQEMLLHPKWSKSDIFNALWQESVQSSTLGLRTESKKAHRKGYTLSIPGLYQGTYESYIDVIGDKKGGTMGMMLTKSPEQWKRYYDMLKSVTGLPVKIFHVIRNPFDNIASTILIKGKVNVSKSFKELKKEGSNYWINSSCIDKFTSKYFKRFQSIESAKVKYDLDVIEIHGIDLITDPKKVISDMCDYLQVSCSDHFISVCSKKIFPKESRTRYQLHWEDSQIESIQKRIEEFKNLHRYIEFDS